MSTPYFTVTSLGVQTAGFRSRLHVLLSAKYPNEIQALGTMSLQCVNNIYKCEHCSYPAMLVLYVDCS